ncbi:hypothetical protein GCM10023189_34920 [Nibrella saemangeumensis]|uniref:Response regulatory domain-containing protein n=1 Tax=Nibrella saemangeumensis TaxID=1084526 RepID=A0ABP8N6M2_9BACT
MYKTLTTTHNATPPFYQLLCLGPDKKEYHQLRETLEAGLPSCLVRPVAHAEALLSYLQHPNTSKPALILIDSEMLGGYSLLSKLKAHAGLQTIPVIIVLSGRKQRSQVMKAYEAGANAVIPLPASPTALYDTSFFLKKFWLQTATLPGEATEAGD